MRKRDELTVGCMARALEGEMTFVLLARDEAAPGTIRDWARRRVESGKNAPDDPQIVEAYKCASVMECERQSVRAALANAGREATS